MPMDFDGVFEIGVKWITKPFMLTPFHSFFGGRAKHMLNANKQCYQAVKGT